MATYGASYDMNSANSAQTLINTSIEDLIYSRQPAWEDLVAIVAPVCHGKTTMIEKYGGYDFDDIIGTDESNNEDSEWSDYVLQLSAAVDGRDGAQARANAIMERRAKRFFALQTPDSNAKILFVHTAELACKLQARVICILELQADALRNCDRIAKLRKDGASDEAEYYLRLAAEQQSANRAYARQHHLVSPTKFATYAEAADEVRMAIESSDAYIGSKSRAGFQVEINEAKARGPRKALEFAKLVLSDSGKYTPHEKAVIARWMYSEWGPASPLEVMRCFNHHLWAQWFHRVHNSSWRATAKRYYSLEGERAYPDTEEGWRAEFPLAAGTSKFAICDVSSWVDRGTDDTTVWAWSRQAAVMLGVGDVEVCSYERLLTTLLYDGVLSTSSSHVRDLAQRVMLGFLPTSTFMKRAAEAHNLIRVAGCVYGDYIGVDDLYLFTYWNCLAGRLPAEVDIVSEAEMRVKMRAEKFFFDPSTGEWSQSLFDEHLRTAIRDGFDETRGRTREGLLRLADYSTEFDKFLKMRRLWGKSGSATGGPKTNVYLKIPAEYRHLTESLVDEVADGVNHVLAVVPRMRLNKNSVFEFREFITLAKDALAEYRPNSFTRYFTKKEVGRATPRSLYPSTLLHYVVVSFVLHLVEKGTPARGTRQNASAEQQREDHWLWRETSEMVTGLMVDYASFNEQHKAKHMKAVLDGVADWYASYKLLTDDLAWAINWTKESMNHIYLEAGGNYWHFADGLLSGWRMTSFVNSWLNRAYLTVIAKQVEVVTQEVVMVTKQSGGDDVAALVDDWYHASLILYWGEQMGFEFKPIKQLLSDSHREFFRLFVTKNGVYGSLCRILGSAASGQWSNSVIGTIVEPATKLASIMDVIFKIQRRTLCDEALSMSNKLALCAFDKWARSGDTKLISTIVHGTLKTGGLGVPTVTGAVHELSGMAKFKPDASPVEIVGAPYDGSLEVVRRGVQQVEELIGQGKGVDVETAAQRMGAKAFQASLASAEGVGYQQLLMPPDPDYYSQRPVVARTLTVLKPPKEKTRNFKDALNRHGTTINALRAAYQRYSALKEFVGPEHDDELLDRICSNLHVERRFIRARDELTLFGYARIALTEDYYDDVFWLGIIYADADERLTSAYAATFAADLSYGGFMNY